MMMDKTMKAPNEVFMKIILFFMLTLSSFSWGQNMSNLNNKDKTKVFFEKLTKDTMHLVDEFYDPQIDFTDPIGSLKGSAKMKAYYANMYKNVKAIRFDFSQLLESGDTVVGIWRMTLVTDKLNGGEPVVVDGNSVLRFKDGKAIYHRDYFDMGAFIYEQLPVLGFVVKKVKGRFKVEE